MALLFRLILLISISAFFAFADEDNSAFGSYTNALKWINDHKVVTPQNFIDQLPLEMKMSAVLVSETEAKRGQSAPGLPRVYFFHIPKNEKENFVTYVMDTNPQSPMYGELHIIEHKDEVPPGTKAVNENIIPTRMDFFEVKFHQNAPLSFTPPTSSPPEKCISCHNPKNSEDPTFKWRPYDVWDHLTPDKLYEGTGVLKKLQENPLLAPILDAILKNEKYTKESTLNAVLLKNQNIFDAALSYYTSLRMINRVYEHGGKPAPLKKLLLGLAYYENECAVQYEIKELFPENLRSSLPSKSEKISLLDVEHMQLGIPSSNPRSSELLKYQTPTLLLLKTLSIIDDPKEFAQDSSIPDIAHFSELRKKSPYAGIFGSGQDQRNIRESVLNRLLVGLYPEKFKKTRIYINPYAGQGNGDSKYDRSKISGFVIKDLFKEEYITVWGGKESDLSSSQFCPHFAELYRNELTAILQAKEKTETKHGR